MTYGPQTPFVEPDSFVFGMYYPGEQKNQSHVDDPVVTDFLIRQRRIADPVKRREVLHDLQRYLARQQLLRADPLRRLHRRLDGALKNYGQPRLRLRRASPRRLAREVTRMQFGWLTLGLSPSSDGDYTAITSRWPRPASQRRRGSTASGSPEHNFTGESVYWRSHPFASVVAARTSRIRIGFAVIQLALRHPIRIATELALLDNLSGGRLDIASGTGPISTSTSSSGSGCAATTAGADGRDPGGDGARVDGGAARSPGEVLSAEPARASPAPLAAPAPADLPQRLLRGLCAGVRPARRAHHDGAHPAARASPSGWPSTRRAWRRATSTPRPGSGSASRRHCGASSTWRRARPRPRTS